MGVREGVGAELLLEGWRPITLIARPSDAADDNERASVGRLARRARGGRVGEDAGRVSRVWLISGSMGEAGVCGVPGDDGTDADDKERWRVLLLLGVIDGLGELCHGSRGRVALRWYGTVSGVRTWGRISVAERSFWRVA